MVLSHSLFKEKRILYMSCVRVCVCVYVCMYVRILEDILTYIFTPHNIPLIESQDHKILFVPDRIPFNKIMTVYRQKLLHRT
jgi:hypothetical protein